MYLDRISESSIYADLQKLSLKSIPNLICSNCQKLLGTPYIYEKEQRLAFRLFVGAIAKKISKTGQIGD
jgi:hypothetical protein